MKFWVAVSMAIAVLPAGAHHPLTPHYDVSRPASITGVVAELRVSNPHVVVILEGTAPDGRTGRWAVEGFPPNVFARRGPTDFRQRLQPGTRVTIAGWPATDPAARAFSGREVTFADGSTMLFGPTPEEADGWSCGTAPCPYAYPDVQAR